MRYLMVVLGLLACAGCSTPVPLAVQPTLAGVSALGFDCGEGVEDNVPSGLLQWSCTGSGDWDGATVLIEGNREGVAAITVVTAAATDPELARAVFAWLVSTVPPLKMAPALIEPLADWDGELLSTIVSRVVVSAECELTQCIVSVVSLSDPLLPLQIP